MLEREPAVPGRPTPARVSSGLVLVVALALVLALAPAVLGTHVQDKLTANDAEDNDRFGFSVALDGDTALVGARFEDGDGDNRGAAYVYTRDDAGAWTQQQKLTADDAEDGDRFGFSVALDGDTALVGAPYEDGTATNGGAAYVYTRSGTTWSQQQKLTADDAEDNDNFARSVALDGDTALVGAVFEDEGAPGAGAAYVYTRSGTTWNQQDKLTADDAEDFDHFGGSVALDGDTALVGAVGEDGAGSNRGAAYVYTRSGTTWNQRDKLTADDAEDGDQFGFSVALDGDTALVGAVGEDGDGDNRGAAYVHTQSGTTWNQRDKLTADDAEDNDNFGRSVALDGDTALVGAFREDGAGSNRGAAYVHTRSGTTWTQQDKLTADDAEDGDRFGKSVAVDGDTALVGAHLEDGDGFLRGAAYAVLANHAPVPDFLWTPTNPTATLDASFTDASTDDDGIVEAWSWDFGDGTTATGANPSHAFPDDGTYTVCLTATDDWGSTATACQDVVVENHPPEPDFTWDVLATPLFTLRFTDNSTDPDDAVSGWTWDFGDGSPAKVVPNPTHTFPGTGTFTVCLTATDEDGAPDTRCHDVDVVSPPPAADFTVDPAEPNALDPVAFTDQSTDIDGEVVAWAWDFGDGQTSTEPRPSHTYDAAGAYEVCLEATDDDAQTGSTCRTLDVSSARPEAAFALETDDAVAGSEVTFRDASLDPDGDVVAWDWDFGDGTTGTEQHPTHTYADPGTYTVTLTATDDSGEVHTTSAEVIVQGRFPWLIVVGIVLLGLVGGGGYWYARMGGKETLAGTGTGTVGGDGSGEVAEGEEE